jgi:hypothetical protein
MYRGDEQNRNYKYFYCRAFDEETNDHPEVENIDVLLSVNDIKMPVVECQRI